MPKLGHVTDLREQWLVRSDGALAHRLQDREISSHLCENRYRNQQIREDFPVAMSEQRDIEHEAYLRELTRRRQADIDAEIAREMAEINLRKQRRRHSSELLQQPGPSRALPVEPKKPLVPTPEEINPELLGLSPAELEDMRRRMEQEEKDARLARQLSHEVDDQDALLADMRYAVEAQDGELARLLQEREYKKLQRAKEKARQKALLKKQQRLSQQTEYAQNETTLADAYSNPRDMIRDNGMRLSKSVDSDLNYVEPFEKEHIQSKAGALQSKEMSRQWMAHQTGSSANYDNNRNYSQSIDTPDLPNSLQHRLPPPVPVSGKKPRFPDPVSIRPASHYLADDEFLNNDAANNNSYSCTFPPDHGAQNDQSDRSKRLSVISDITAEGLIKRNKQAEMSKKKKGCKIQ